MTASSAPFPELGRVGPAVSEPDVQRRAWRLGFRVSAWLVAFGLTLGVEVSIYFTLLGLPWPRRLGAAFAPSILTHPIVWFVLPGQLVPRIGYWGYVAVAEAFVVLAESAICIGFGATERRAFTAAAVANAASFGVGYLLLH